MDQERHSRNGTLTAESLAVRRIVDALRGLRFGSVTIVVQDGLVVQIDRLEKQRLPRPSPLPNPESPPGP